MKFGKGLIFLGCGLLMLGMVSCESTKTSGGQGANAAQTGDGSINAAGFLKTDYAPLSKWLDERFEVDYKHMTPELIFNQVPLNDLNYDTVNLPTNAESFNFSSSDVSRRELLKKISTHWNLKMALVTDESGVPYRLRVEG